MIASEAQKSNAELFDLAGKIDGMTASPQPEKETVNIEGRKYPMDSQGARHRVSRRRRPENDGGFNLIEKIEDRTGDLDSSLGLLRLAIGDIEDQDTNCVRALYVLDKELRRIKDP